MKKENVKDDFFTPEEINEVVNMIDKALADFEQIPPTEESLTTMAIKMVEAAAKTGIPYSLNALKQKAQFGCGCKSFIREMADAIVRGKETTIFATWMEIDDINKKYYPIPSKSKKKSTSKKK